MRHSLAAIILLTLSLGLKLNGSYASPEDDEPSARADLAAQLRSAGFAVTVQPHQVDARRGACVLSARMLDPHGTYRAFFASRLEGAGRIGYAWRGEWYESLPRFGPLMEFYAMRELVRQGLSGSRGPVWMVGRNAQCSGLAAQVFDRPVMLKQVVG